jgi:hypothetical protein
MIIDLERKVQPVIKCVRFEGSNTLDVIEVVGNSGYLEWKDNELIVGCLNHSYSIRLGQYIVSDNGKISVLSVNEVLHHYNYIDFEQGQQLEYDLGASVESRTAFFNKVKDFFGE